MAGCEGGDSITAEIQQLISAVKSESPCYQKVVESTHCLSRCPSFSELESTLLNELLYSLVNYGLMPSVPEAEERELETKDFKDLQIKAIVSCKCIKLVLNGLQKSKINELLIPLLLFCGQHIEHNLWTDEELEGLCQEVLTLILSVYSYSSVNDLLTTSNNGFFIRKIFLEILPFLSRSNWKSNPGMISSFRWLLLNIKYPHVGDIINEVLPSSLLFVDDFILTNRIHGIKCLHHIAENSPTAELKWYGRAEVMYNALKNLVHHRDPVIIANVYPCLLKIVSVLEKDPQKPSNIRKVNRFDELYQHLLGNMDSEQTLVLRNVYSRQLSTFINLMGITTMRHTKRTIRILTQYLEVYDDPEESTRINCLKALQNLIKVTWPRHVQEVETRVHLAAIMQSLVRLLYDMNGSMSSSNPMAEYITRCLVLLHQLLPDDFEVRALGSLLNFVVANQLLNISTNIPSLAIFKEILHSSSLNRS